MKWLRNLNLISRFLLIALFTSILPLLLVYLIYLNKSSAILVEVIRNDLTEKAFLVAKDLDRFVQQRVVEIKVLSQADVLESNDPAAIRQYFQEVIVESSYLADIDVIDRQGRVTISAAADEETGQHKEFSPQLLSLFNQSKEARQGQVFVSELLKLPSGPALMLFTPITDDANIKVIAVLSVTVKLEIINKIVTDFDNRIVGNKHVYIVDNDGRVMISGDPTVAPLEVFPDLRANQDLLKKIETPGEVGSIIYRDLAGDQVMAGFADMAEFGMNQALDWSIIAIAPMKDITAPARQLNRFLTLVTLAIVLLVVVVAWLASKGLAGQIRQASAIADQIASGNYEQEVSLPPGSNEIGTLARSLQQMLTTLRRNNSQVELNDWLKSGQMELAACMRGSRDLQQICNDTLTCMASYVGAQVATFYVADDEGEGYLLTATYAFERRKELLTRLEVGQGLAGQALAEKRTISISEVPEDYVRISSSLGHSQPRELIAVPLVYQNRVLGVMELGFVSAIPQRVLEFLQLVPENIAITLKTVQDGRRTEALLEKNQQQTARLQASEEELQAQQEELQVSNEELQEANSSLQAQKDEIEAKNQALENSRQEVEQASRYKSAFLANMSHEIRTPLNSLLALSRNLARNKENNLHAKQVNDLEIIHNSGSELLSLLNDVLDISKVEAGKMTTSPQLIHIPSLMADLANTFRSLAVEKKIDFKATMADNCPEQLFADQVKVGQILRNIVANALKFTDEGGVTVTARQPQADEIEVEGLQASAAILFDITDSGIGIPADKINQVFEAFQQADGSTTRRYGGTGLGLTISRDLVCLLGGEIRVASRPDQGTTFTIILPLGLDTPAMAEARLTDSSHKEEKVKEEQSACAEGEAEVELIPNELQGKRILVVDDDVRNLYAVTSALEPLGATFLKAGTGMQALRKLEQEPDIDLVIMDIMMPGMDGVEVVEKIRAQPAHKKLPILMLTAKSMEEDRQTCLQAGASDYLVKPFKLEKLVSALRVWLHNEGEG